jgi:hypothetical protein
MLMFYIHEDINNLYLKFWSVVSIN